MNKKYIFLFIIISQIFSYDEKKCIDNLLFSNHHIIEKKIFLITAEMDYIENSLVKIYVEEKKKFRIDFDDIVIVSDKNKIMKYNLNTNQLFIEKSDSLFNQLFFSLNDFDLFYEKLENHHLFEKIKFFPNVLCDTIDSIKFNNQETTLFFNSIKFLESDLETIDFKFDRENTFIYDFR